MFAKRFLSLAVVASTVLMASCLKNDNSPNQPNTPVQDPSLEIAQINRFTDSMGFTNMVYDPALTGFKYEILDRGDTVNNKLTSNMPVGAVRYIGKLMNGFAFDSSYKLTDSALIIDFSKTQVIAAWQYVLTYASSKTKIGKGGHIRFVTPSAYGYGGVSNGKLIPANSPLFFDIYLKDVRSY